MIKDFKDPIVTGVVMAIRGEVRLSLCLFSPRWIRMVISSAKERAMPIPSPFQLQQRHHHHHHLQNRHSFCSSPVCFSAPLSRSQRNSSSNSSAASSVSWRMSRPVLAFPTLFSSETALNCHASPSSASSRTPKRSRPRPAASLCSTSFSQRYDSVYFRASHPCRRFLSSPFRSFPDQPTRFPRSFPSSRCIPRFSRALRASPRWSALQIPSTR